jgi:hypothetical protein
MRTRPFLAPAALVCLLTPSHPCSGETGAPGAVRCVFVDPFSSASFAFAGMSREAREILEHVGVQTVWREEAGVPASRDGNEVFLILLRRPAGTLPPRTLGAVMRSSAPNAWLYSGTITDILGLDPNDLGGWTDVQRIDFARALGRVAAHELVHLLLPALPHSHAGLMRPTVARRDLIHDAVTLDASVKNAFAGWAAGTSGVPHVAHAGEPVGAPTAMTAW